MWSKFKPRITLIRRSYNFNICLFRITIVKSKIEVSISFGPFKKVHIIQTYLNLASPTFGAFKKSTRYVEEQELRHRRRDKNESKIMLKLVEIHAMNNPKL